MKFKKRILITVIIGIILVSVFFIITNTITKYTGFSVVTLSANFEKCLNKQDIILYINSEDSAEVLRNVDIELIEHLKNIKIKNCFRDEQTCLENGIYSFPSWIINNNKIVGDVSIEELSEISGCKLRR